MKTPNLQNFLELDSLTLIRDEEFLLKDISLTLPAGEILCLLGPSGAGKTSLLRLIAGLDTPNTGTIKMAGRDLSQVTAHKRNIGMMFQEYALFPHKSVQDNIRFGLEMHKVSTKEIDRRVDEMLKLVGLNGFGHRRIDELSGGERQRVALARSLAPHPQMLLLDEPFGSLDRRLRERLATTSRDILLSLGMTTIFVTHDQSEAFSVADRIGILHEGKLIQYAPPEELYQKPANQAVAHFLGFDNILYPDSLSGGENFLYNRIKAGIKRTIGVDQLFLLRPEGAILAESAVTDGIRISGMVHRRIFQGGSFLVKLEVEGELLSFLLPMNPPPPQTGETISLILPESGIVVLPPERN